MQCKDCDEWKLIEDEGNELNGKQKGRCHGGLPTVTAVVMPVVNKFTQEVIPQIIEITSWPVTSADCCGCGVFKPRVVRFKLSEAKAKRDKLETKDL